MEVGDSAESLLDARATRRLVQLELSEIDVPPPSGNKRAPAPLFFRVVQVGQNVRVELWERGEYHGARVVSGSNAAGQLGARRVALAAAELARRLQKKRQVQAARERVADAARLVAAARDARRALDGPLAIRSSLELASIGDLAATLAGPRLLAQWTFARRARIEAGFAWLAGSAPAAANSEWLELSLSPMQRVSLGEALDLDLGLTVAAAWLRLAKVRSVDAILDQNETWSARAAAVVRIEPRISREMRLSLGADAAYCCAKSDSNRWPAAPSACTERGSDSVSGWCHTALASLSLPEQRFARGAGEAEQAPFDAKGQSALCQALAAAHFHLHRELAVFHAQGRAGRRRNARTHDHVVALVFYDGSLATADDRERDVHPLRPRCMAALASFRPSFSRKVWRLS